MLLEAIEDGASGREDFLNLLRLHEIHLFHLVRNDTIFFTFSSNSRSFPLAMLVALIENGRSGGEWFSNFFRLIPSHLMH
jgi:hypothetical protein